MHLHFMWKPTRRRVTNSIANTFSTPEFHSFYVDAQPSLGKLYHLLLKFIFYA